MMQECVIVLIKSFPFKRLDKKVHKKAQFLIKEV